MSAVVVFDSGLGGLSVVRALHHHIGGRALMYVADNAGFPYGDMAETVLVRRAIALFDRLMADHDPAVAVIACNTASTLVLPPLRDAFSIPFVGTVPAIKPAAKLTVSGMVSVLATPGTVARDYTRDLVDEFAGGVDVTLVAAPTLAALAEAHLAGQAYDRGALAAEIAPAFVERGGRRTDTVVLACTHYPLILDALRGAAPWPVSYVDPAEAIARRVAAVLDGPSPAPGSGDDDAALFTDIGRVSPAMGALLEKEGFSRVSGLRASIDLDGVGV